MNRLGFWLGVFLCLCACSETPTGADSMDDSRDDVVQGGMSGTGGEGVAANSVLLAQSEGEAPLGACPNGGVLVAFGVDSNANGELDDEEIQRREAICHGADGTNGTNGADGQPGAVGQDGQSVLIRQTQEEPRDNCATGGARIETGVDVNGDGELQDSEVTATSFVCNGTDGTNGADGMNGANGANGTDGADGTDGTNGVAGDTSLIRQSTEPPGANCEAGGLKVESGIDTNRNNVLDDEEVTTTTYLCTPTQQSAIGGHCNDGILSGDETDVDCGGSRCPFCQVGQACGAHNDCDSLSCIELRCVAVLCDDGVQNGTETGLDCGGLCPPCVVDPADLCIEADDVYDEPLAVSQFCETQTDCDGSAIAYDVGKLTRDLARTNKINVGTYTIAIRDVEVERETPICSEPLAVGDSVSCQGCIACGPQNPCAPILMEPLFNEMFANDPLATLAGTLLKDLIWGEQEASYHFFCQPLSETISACQPCGDPRLPCDGDSGPCRTGGRRDATQSDCEAQVCAADALCCDGFWDSQCVSIASEIDACGCAELTADPCVAGFDASANGGNCVTSVCEADGYCCESDWDAVCVSAAQTIPECGCD